MNSAFVSYDFGIMLKVFALIISVDIAGSENYEDWKQKDKQSAHNSIEMLKQVQHDKTELVSGFIVLVMEKSDSVEAHNHVVTVSCFNY